ncbi:hypothetical protein HMPREF2141_01184 [Bacteroides uniformis]|uniref:Uncharacterized protein n=1 Tax=Bacteroides uniformis (strain ATCC 8492 / DSM 6597 / CCUG 4942 / CIP 103695 / JCM 5828 / KCTC 5204 / NCTC 13054 / VPI 0061) TaxID=411479 RepID=A0ABC9N556_BACUC|nr:hypothetical protein BACUNI_04327 [Bacteroides uniformis ATCC 8492]KXT37001.1 hypothetical protein HMPREF2141_01184 [Bacteroides uniformis]
MKNEGFIRTASAHCTTNSSSFILHSSLIFRIFVPYKAVGRSVACASCV